MEYVIPSEDTHWQIQERDPNLALDECMFGELGGGYAVAYKGRRDPVVVYLKYEERRDGGWFGMIQSTRVVEDDPIEVWQHAYGLYEEGDPDELTTHYKWVVAPLSDSDFLEALAEYEAGALDFIGDLESGVHTELCIWSGVIRVSTSAEARRYIEAMAHVLLVG